MSDFNTDVGLKIFNARKNLKMSRVELGKKVNLHESTIKRYEDGHIKSLDIEKLKEFANALDISPAYLMGWEEEKKESKSTFKANEVTEKNENKLSEKEQLLLDNFNKLNNLGKKKVINYTKDLTEVNKYINIESSFEIDTIAAHNDYLHLDGEMENIMKDLEDMDNW